MTAEKIAIIDYGMGNLHSVKRKLDLNKANSFITSSHKEILEADKVVLVGVGHFKKAMTNLKELNLVDVLNEVVLVKRKPILGICLGMALMTKTSEEGGLVDGLGWVDAKFKRFQFADTLRYKVPHTGWNEINFVKESELMKDIPNESEFYFVHSYYCEVEDTECILNETEYGKVFTSAFEKDNIFGVQYHPEKSHDQGNQLLTNFIRI
jgi:glutamine amidotransferase